MAFALGGDDPLPEGKDDFVRAVMQRIADLPQIVPARTEAQTLQSVQPRLKEKLQTTQDHARWTRWGLCAGLVVWFLLVMWLPDAIPTPDIESLGPWLIGTLVAILATSTAALRDLL